MNKLNFLVPLQTVALLGAGAIPMFGQTAGSAPRAIPPYRLSVFAPPPPDAGLSAPDSIAVVGGSVFVGYGDGHAPDGSDGKSSQIVQYDMNGTLTKIFTVPGHNDGLKVNPATHELWALQNEDASTNLVIIDPGTGQQTQYGFGSFLHGGGYDDIVFRGCGVFISASNPANNPNTGPAIVSARLQGNMVEVQPVLAGEATAIDIPSDAAVKLNLQDPDSMTLDPLGDIVLDSQADQELIIVSAPGTSMQRVLRLPLSYQTPTGVAAVEVDDTAFTTSTEGFILFADKGLNEVFMLSKQAFAPGAAYTAADGGPFVGTIDLNTGLITPIVTGLSNPGGLVFVDTSEQSGGNYLQGMAPCGGPNRD